MNKKEKLANKLIPIVIAVVGLIVLVICLEYKSKNAFPEIDLDNLVVYIDAGHGGSDVGAVGDGERYEKDDNLQIALLVRDELIKQNVKVVMTRETDSFVELADICKFSNEQKAQLFVSIHRNSAEGDASGVEIWVKKSGGEADKMLAKNILKQLDDAGIASNRGVKTGFVSNENSDYYVNKYTNAPSCLLELGFITSDEDNELLDKKAAQYAKAIADGIVLAAYEIDNAR